MIKLVKDNFRIKAGLIIGITFAFYILLVNNLNLWLDEIYSVLMAKDSFQDMWFLLSTEDSKPPLYYVYLKLVLSLFPKTYEIWAAHFGSFILLIGAQIFAATAVKNDYGEKVALWLMALMALLAPSLWLAFEVRTYILSNLLLLMAAVFGCRLIKKATNTDYFYFGITSLLALYSHYYCCFWLLFFYSGIFYFLIKEHKEKFMIKKFLLTAFIVALLFLPWLYVPLKTASKISHTWYVNYSFVEFSWRFFTNPLAPEIVQSVFFVATSFAFSIFSFILLLGLIEHTNKSNQRPVCLILGSFLCTYGVLLVLSYAIRPMVTARYLKIYCFILYFAGAIILTWFKNIQKAFLCASVIGFIFTYIDVYAVTFDEGYKILINDVKKFVPKNLPIINFDNSNLFCEYYLPEYTCLLATDGKGEILRRHKVMQNLSYYSKEDQGTLFSLSIFDPTPRSNCIKYSSLYRNEQSVNICRHSPEEVHNLLEKSRESLLSLGKTP